MMSADKVNLSQVGAFLKENPTTDSDRVKAPVVYVDPTDSLNLFYSTHLSVISKKLTYSTSESDYAGGDGNSRK